MPRPGVPPHRPAQALDKDSNARANFKVALAFIDRTRPSRSALLRKPLALADGLAHGGGEQVRRTSPEYTLVLTFARGEALGRPTAAVSPLTATETGKPVALDGRSSADPANSRLGHVWSLHHVPEGSTAAIDGQAKPKATFTPDRPGVYVVELVVTNAASAPAHAHVVVHLPAAAVATEAPSGDALAAKQRVVLALYDQLLGRAPTAPERARALATPVPRLVWEFREIRRSYPAGRTTRGRHGISPVARTNWTEFDAGPTNADDSIPPARARDHGERHRAPILNARARGVRRAPLHHRRTPVDHEQPPRL